VRGGGKVPAKYAAPPCDICKMMGAFASRAASKAATTVDEEVTFYTINLRTN